MLMESAPLTVTVLAAAGHDVLELAGEVDLATTPLLYEQVRRLLADGRNRLVLDLDQVTFMDATALGFLVATHRHVTASDGAFAVRYQDAPVPALLRITGLAGMLSND